MTANKKVILNPAYQRASFIISAAAARQFPEDSGREVAIVGRSNAGKSSAINVITRQNSLARVSKTPGRTQLINFFRIDDSRRLVDLPGYGYAKVPGEVREEWGQVIDQYLRNRQSLCGVLVVMDIRHPLKDFDRQLLAWCGEAEIPAHILLTKADKLSKGAAANTLQKVRHELGEIAEEGRLSVQTFSALKNLGIEEVYAVLDDWLGFLQAKKSPGQGREE